MAPGTEYIFTGGFRVLVDTRETSRDFIVEGEASGSAFSGKVLSTPRDPAGAVLTGTKDLTPNPVVLDILVTQNGLRDTYTIALRHHPARRAGDESGTIPGGLLLGLVGNGLNLLNVPPFFPHHVGGVHLPGRRH
jgi:hypothetical protein